MSIGKITFQTLSKISLKVYLIQLVDLDGLLCQKFGMVFSEAPWKEAQFEKDLTQKWNFSLIAFDQSEQRLVGFSICSQMLEKELHIHRFGVHPDYQGEGIGQAFIQRHNQMMEEFSLKRITVETNRQNEMANVFYKRAGFRSLKGGDLQAYAGVRKSKENKILDEYIEEPSGQEFRIYYKAVNV